MATTASNKDAAKVAKLREMAKDKSLPQDVRNTYLDQAVKLEEKAAKDAGVKLAKGGMPVRGERTATNKAKKMMYGGMAEKTKMAVGGMLPPPATPRTGAAAVAPKKSLAEVGAMVKAQMPATKSMKVVNRQPTPATKTFTAVSRKMAVGGMMPPPPMPRKGPAPVPAPTSPMKDRLAQAGSILKAQMPATKSMTVVNRQPVDKATAPTFTAVNRKMAKGGAVKKAKK